MGVINEIGNRYGNLVVVERAPNDSAGRAYWKCQCDCGNFTTVRGTTLRSGTTKSCGCLQKQIAKSNGNDLTGKRFDRLIVIEQAENNTKHRGKFWKCKCGCGNFIITRGDNLISGATKSCGCLQKEKAGQWNFIDETGNRYGKLVVLKQLNSDSEGHSRWECQCDCGNTKICYGVSLRRGVNLSCGCLTSSGEMNIEKELSKNNIIYEKQYTFDNLRSKKGSLLRFDFAIFNKNKELKCLIEFQGEQHTDKNNWWYSEEGAERDKAKKEYCKNNNILLYEWDKNTDLEQAVQKLNDEGTE